MDKARLQQLQHLRREVKQLERQLRHMESLRPERQKIEQDSVQASMDEFPYTTYTLKIKGIGMSKRSRQIQQLRMQLWDKQQECMEELVNINGCINSVKDSEARQILRMRYIEGLTIRQIGVEMGYCERQVKRKLSTAYQKLSPNVPF